MRNFFINKIKKYLAFFLKILNYPSTIKYKYHRKKANKTLNELFNNIFFRKKNSNYIICEGLWDNPHHWLRLSIFGPVLANYLNSNLMGIYLKGTNKSVVRTINTFNFSKYIELECTIKKRHYEKAKSYYLKLRSNKDIFNLSLPYDYPGQFLYDSILKGEMIGTISYKDKVIEKYIAKLICFLEEYEKIFDNQKIKALIISHPVSIRFSTLACIALKKNIPVYVMNYLNEYISLRKLNNLEDWENGAYEKPLLSHIKKLPKTKKNHLEKVGSEYLKQVRLAKRGEVSSVGAFNQETNFVFSKKKFLKNLNLDSLKPTGVIMTGCWPDFPNIYPPTWYLDYVDWFEQTLEIIKGIKNANWIIKPHPAEFKYGAKTKMIHFAKNINEENIVIWPKDLPANYINEIADVLITSHGTSGIEYPAQGKPVIISKKTHFEEWGFVNYCATFSEYKKSLSNLNLIKKPTKSSKKLANIYLATFLCNGSNIEKKYLFDLGSKSQKLWTSITNFININQKNISYEQDMMKKWLESDIQSYNFFKSINYTDWGNK
ncbi:hypothetical protein OA859_00770 [Prochlorococcus sp. AH-716-D13]|nr:hypothetical protein [Prochlorococcus sp. AH-716-D13]